MIFYFLIYGDYPFRSKNQNEYIQKIKNSDI